MKKSPINTLSILACFLLSACQSIHQSSDSKSHHTFATSQHKLRPHLSAQEVDTLFLQTRHAPHEHSDDAFLDITDHMLTESHQKLARKVLETLDPVTPDTIKHKKFNMAYVAILSKDMAEAKRRLENLSHSLTPEDRVAFYSMLSIYHLQKNQFRHYFKAANQAYLHAKLQKRDALADDMLIAIWHSIQTASSQDINDLLAYRLDLTTKGWLSLRNLVDLEKGSVLQDAGYTLIQLQEWHKENPNHPAIALFSSIPNLKKPVKTPEHISVLLPYQGTYQSAAEAITAGIQASYLEAHPSFQKLSFHDTASMGSTAAYQDAIRQSADSIIGPLKKEDIAEIKQQKNFSIPTLGLNYSPDIEDKQLSQFSLSPNLEIDQLSQTMRTQGYRSTLIIQDTNKKSQDITARFKNLFEADGGQIADTITLEEANINLSQSISKALDVSSSEARANNITRVLGEKPRFIPQRRRDFDSILLISSAHYARQAVPLLRYHFSGKTPVFSTSAIYNGHNDPDRNKDLNGVRFFDTPHITPQMENASHTFAARTLNNLRKTDPDHFYENFRFHAMGIDAYLVTGARYLWNYIPSYLIAGSTGYINKNQQDVITRQLQQLVIQNGKVKIDRYHPNQLKTWQLILQTAVLHEN